MQTVKYSVLLGNDRKIKGVGQCEDVKLLLQGLSMSLNFIPFHLRGIDVILGIEWLKKLGEVKIN